MLLKQAAFWHKLSRVGLPPPFIATEVGSREVRSSKSEVGSQKSEDPPRLSYNYVLGRG